MSLLDNFIKTSDQVVEFEAFFSGIPAVNHSIHTLEIHKDEILRHWDEFRRAYDEILVNYKTLGKEVKVETLKERFYKTFDSHVRALSKANEILDSLRIKDVSSDTSPPSSSDSKPCISLPPCDTQTFYGDYVSWPSFRDMFTALYINNKQLSPVEKLFHLLKKTEGEPHDILKNCPLTNDGFEIAWGNLVDRYENTRVLVHTQLKALFNLLNNPIYRESGPSIKQLQRSINDCRKNLALLKIDTSNWDVIFVFICAKCLPDISLHLWQQHLGNTKELPLWKEMDSFLTCRYQSLEGFADIRTTSVDSQNFSRKGNFKKHNSNQPKKINTFQTKVSNDKTKKCSLCNEFHPLRLCPVFLSMSIEDRYSVAKKQKRCTNCLGTSHDYKACKSEYTCSLCKRKHHSLLHRSQNPTVSNQTSTRQPTNSSINTIHESAQPQPVNNLDEYATTSAATRSQQSYSTQLQSTTHNSIVLGTALVDICVGNVRRTVRALIDSASEATFISKKLQSTLLLPTKSSHTNITGLSGSLTATATQICPIRISSPVEKLFETTADAYVINKLTGDLPYYEMSSLMSLKFSDLPLADNYSSKTSKVELLLGCDIYPKIIRDGVRWDHQRSLVAQRTIFGWIITGRLQSPNSTLNSVSSFINTLDLNKEITKFWELEEVPQVRTMSNDDLFCENLYKSTTYRDNSGRFVVYLPFKSDFPNDLHLGHSRNSALAQFIRNETRLLRNPQYKTDYDQVIEEYSILGHMIKISNDNDTPNSSYYLPHHSVLKPESTTTKLRVVFNASSATSTGLSLNDVILPGPVLQQDLTVLITRWRLFKYVFNADIEKMYRQILVNPRHTPFQRIIFRNSPDKEIEDFELQTVTFGVNCAPYLAIRTLLELSEQCKNDYPEVSNILNNHMYVDDVLAGSHELSLALRSRDELIKVLDSAKFSLRKWISNENSLLVGLKPEHLLSSDILKLEDTTTTKTLGLRWNAGLDFFYFNPIKQPSRENITKRTVLSDIAKLFDPAGWLAPKIIIAKMIMQQIWKDQIDWDENLKPETLNSWLSFLDDYPNIEQIKIPRFVGYTPSCTIEFHGFCDASEKAYAATLYIRTINENNHISSHLLLSKTKVAPVKFLTLPRKELCGAELLSKLVSSFLSQVTFNSFELHCWTDSTIVLAWLQKHPTHWNTFVANRVTSIIDKVGNDKWRHVCSQDNPADLGTRGLNASELVTNDLWWYGPPWLRLPNSEWPSISPIIDTIEEIKPIRSHLNQLSEDILSRFSDLARAMRAIHLEVTSEISTPAFLAAFSRFFSRRGTPKALYSDNGTAFVGASNIFNKNQIHLLSQIRNNLLAQHSFQTIDWHFIPPGAPHMGGLWEAGVKSFKLHLKKITHVQSFTFEEFTTMITRIESCLNSRPLCPMSENPNDLCALTPGHFLIGAPLLSPPEPDLSNQSLSYVNRWQKLNVLHHHFACRWKEEYLKEMHKRIKWKYPQKNFSIGDLVVIKKDKLPPNEWRLGRIEKVFPGHDNNIRVAEIRTSSGILTRPITKLVLLPTHSDQSN
ncbi:uncharacterized protein LOC119609875 [Lucilia sericata]|uniref:uncharacterized protein LOC119609875 n=1 Tax=Lucilia sericata TaxID=13632 RepID=UPI0018A806E3|nr:uncharacterized protein LOC119609875 [Lucilia sericata]